MQDAQDVQDAPKVHYTGRALLSMPAQQVFALLKLRVEVFVNEQRAPFAEIDDTDAYPGTHHIMAYVHPGSGHDCPFGVADPGSPLRLVGTARVFGPPEEQHIGRMCVAEDMRGYGIAHGLLKEALEVCTARAAALDPNTHNAVVKIEAQIRLQGFYESYGFEPVGEVFEEEGIKHIEMHKKL
ncbi:GNAT family N-acetyltransferase [Corynebacterium sp. 320]|uniref:GNAT family N-acetyltransferase n=2 Tax=Corynebacteriaceae TaxID=1653 RepID=A0ABQ6VGG3_9CORY|nr:MULTISPECIES: GNAT family N-acetyltransferase [Corynebacterium]KAB1503228.1 GNAT family N-acetyltransferase [Corynebacterium sp. 320]KAB1550814.1 GNAT family N-acetyltransferase [Corynebacterium sp. 321]KAB1551171.1 GNAT family N-acetyltransferase [Corynebacterium sp. 319]KAB3520026.1 GNAT family N-acetyltransferase [Corynebacterium zhongnanshanii]KAB3527025.1 GNAT family N-acetyltransferase [Corynebacterium sp. 250]